MRERNGSTTLLRWLCGHGAVVSPTGVLPSAATATGALQVITAQEAAEEAGPPRHGTPTATPRVAEATLPLLGGACLPRTRGPDKRPAPLQLHPGSPPSPQDIGGAGEI